MQTFSTLAERMSAGRLLAADALRIAKAFAERLRQVHDQGQVHGSLTPFAILVGETEVELQPAASALTPYTAPEIFAGRPADERSDIFAFGAIVYEMFTGQRAFEGSDEVSVMLALASASPRPSGNTALDHVVSGCVAKLPDARFQGMREVQPELRKLASTVRRSASNGTAAPAVPAAAAPAPAPAPNGEVHDLEARIAARFEQQDQALASFQQVANEVLSALRAGALANAPARQPMRPFGGIGLENETSLGRMDRAFELLSDKVARIDLAVGNAVERLLKLEQQLDEFDIDAAALRDSVTRDVRNFERALKSHNAAIESARTAMGQTDDLVERVVEALDSLQSMFMPGSEERLAAS